VPILAVTTQCVKGHDSAAGSRSSRKLPLMWPGPLSPTSTAGPYGNFPLPPRPPLPDPRESQVVDRRLGMWCSCPLIDCCHNEDQDPCPSGSRPHVHSGSPVSGYTRPWEPGDDSWKDPAPVDVVARPFR
jgi:hypothetical protein